MELSKRNTEQVIDETPALLLPPELIGEIAGNLLDDQAALCSLSLASKLLQNECQPLLYRVVLHKPLNGRGAPVTTFKKFPYLTRHIHTYHIDQLGTYAPRKDSWDLLRPGPALSAMRNLKSLHVRLFHGNMAQDILTDCPFQLVSFSCILPLETGRLLQFLATQWSIRCLRISVDIFSGPLAVPACENLEHLEGDRGSIETFLPGRRVTSLVWIPSWGDSTSGVEHLANEFGAIQKLTFHTNFGRKHVVGFNTIVPYLQNLQCLELTTFSIDPLDYVHFLPNLIGLILSKNFQYLRDLSDERQAIFWRCSRLSFLDIELGEDSSNLPREFERYGRTGDMTTYHRPVAKRFFNSFADVNI